MSEEYPYNGRLSRWDEVAEGLAIVGVQKLDGEFPFEPGQYATLGLLGSEGRLVQRPMSICSPADELSEYEFLIRLVPEGAFTPLLWRRTVGDPINVKGPKGKFLLQEDGRKAVMVSSGTGLAPFMSMIETLIRHGRRREIFLIHGVSYDRDLAYRSRIEAVANGLLPLTYLPTVSRPHACPGWTGLTGRAETIVARQLDEHRLDPSNATLYLCGNPDMITAVEELAIDRGFPPTQIRKELYWPKGRQH